MKSRTWIFASLGLLAALSLAAFVSPYASPAPDGLERVATDKGFLEKAEARPLWRHALMPDYLLRGWGNGPASTATAGLLGTLCAFAVGCALARVVKGKSLGAPVTPAKAEASLPTLPSDVLPAPRPRENSHP